MLLLKKGYQAGYSSYHFQTKGQILGDYLDCTSNFELDRTRQTRIIEFHFQIRSSR